jgi:hypothetical protein
MRCSVRQRLNLVALLVFVTAGPVDAQIAGDGAVRGVVRDAEGGVLPGVTVTAVSPTVPGTYVSVSESDGQYRLLNLPPGVFDIAAELAGFTKYTRRQPYVSLTPAAAKGSFRLHRSHNGTRESAGGSRLATTGSRSPSVS